MGDYITRKVSVAMCTYNGEKYICDQLRSVLSQSVPVFEIIICDDGSTDNTLEIAESILSNAKVKYVLHRNTEQLGVTKNFENSITACSGDYIFTCDQDDVWEYTKVEKILSAFEDPDCILVFSDAHVIDDNGKSSEITLHQRLRFLQNEKDRKAYLDAITRLQYTVHGCLMAFRRSLIPGMLPFPQTKLNHDAWIQYCASLQGNITYLDESLVFYRIHSSNVTQSAAAQDVWRKTVFEGTAFDRHFQMHIFREQRCELMERALLCFSHQPKKDALRCYRKATTLYHRLCKMQNHGKAYRILSLLASFLDGTYSYRNMDRLNQSNGLFKRGKLLISDLIFLLKLAGDHDKE